MAKSFKRDPWAFDDGTAASAVPDRKPKFHGSKDEFRCRHCRVLIGPPPSGGRQRNHCPFCLYSRHVDGTRPGDRGSDCGGSMEPIARFERHSGEVQIIHRCHDCCFERHNRIAADDDYALVLTLPEREPASASSGDEG
jgi:hypothetical protein